MENQKKIVLVSHEIHKLFKSICEQKQQNVKDEHIKELENLKTKCKSENVEVCLYSVFGFVKLVEDGFISTGYVLSMFMSMLPNSSSSQYTAITDGIVGLLLIDLRRKSHNLKNKECYVCPFDLRPPQHPIIMLIQTDGRNMNDIGNKINGICNHHDADINKHSLEFLRPVYLYILCNSSVIPESKTLWLTLLSHAHKSEGALNLIREIIAWGRFSTSTTCLHHTTLLAEVIEHMYLQKNSPVLIELIIYFTSIIRYLYKYGYDPRPSLNLIYKVLFMLDDNDGGGNNTYQNLMVHLLAESFHSIASIYLSDMIRVIKYLIITKNAGTLISKLIILDALIQWIAFPSFISSQTIDEIQELMKHINSESSTTTKTKFNTKMFSSCIRYYNPDIALAYNVCILCEKLEYTKNSTLLASFVKNVFNSQKEFAMKIRLTLQGLFLSRSLGSSVWQLNFEILLRLVEQNESFASSFLMTVLYKLANEVKPECHVVLLKGIPEFAVAKENVPIVLNTLQALSQKSMLSFCIELYLRLWKIEPRTYSFLFKILSTNVKGNEWEHHITRVRAIQDICQDKSYQYGTDLVALLSEILNKCSDKRGDTATSIALDTITVLCENNVINIVSAWSTLSGKFKSEKRVKVIQSLCQLFGRVPCLRNPTMEYESLLTELTKKLWHFVVNVNEPEIIRSALVALKNYKIEDMELILLPEIFRQNLVIPASLVKTPVDAGKNPVEILTYIPGKCWLQMLQNINHDAIEAADDLIAHYIYKEIEGFRGGVYALPEGHSEPNSLRSLPPKSVLRAITSFVIEEAQTPKSQNNFLLLHCLRILSKKFPKPIPPLNWCFLHDIFHHGFEMKKYSLILAINQSNYSGTAKRFIENYLVAFSPDETSIDDILVLYDVLHGMCEGVNDNILKTFLKKCWNFAWDQMNNNIDDKLFEKSLQTVKTLFLDGTIKNDANRNVLIEIVTVYFDIIDYDHRIFELYVETLCALPVESVDGLTSPNAWWDIPVPKLKKALIVRCYLAQHDKSLDNPLYWLTPIIDSFVQVTSEQNYFFRRLISVFHAMDNKKKTCDWILEILGQIQSLLADDEKVDVEKCIYLCDIFTIAIVVFSGVGNLFGDLDAIALSRQNRLNVFPESLHILCELEYWSTNETKIYEFLYHMYKNPLVPNFITDVYKYAIICSKNHPYFQQKEIWTKYITLRK